MADKNIQMAQRNATNDGWDNLYPKTKAENVVGPDGTTVAAHMADETSHITATERTTWNSKETPDGARKKVEQTDFKVYKTNKDSEEIFTIVEYKRVDGTLAIKAVLSGGTSPQYTTRTITYYGLDGVTVEKTTTRTLSYDADGALTSEA